MKKKIAHVRILRFSGSDHNTVQITRANGNMRQYDIFPNGYSMNRLQDTLDDMELTPKVNFVSFPDVHYYPVGIKFYLHNT